MSERDPIGRASAHLHFSVMQRTDRALRLILGLDISPGPLDDAARALAAHAIDAGLHIATYSDPLRVAIRDGADRVLWSGEWTLSEPPAVAWHWRERWAVDPFSATLRERHAPAPGKLE